jgi:hypothetical protein
MTKENKILLGIGAVVIAYYLYTTNKNKAVANQQPTTPTPPNTGDSPKVYYCKDGFKKTLENNPNIQNIRYANPCEGHGGIDEIKTNGGNNPTPTPISDDYHYEALENFTVEYFNSTTGNNKIATFTKGQIIHAKPIPMGRVGGLVTTPDGKYPNMAIGNTTVILPENKIKRVNISQLH